jgi:polyisoprenoid-binding protein YceI
VVVDKKKLREDAMNKTLRFALGGLIFAAATAAPSFAQGNTFTLNPEHSVAAVSVGNSADESSSLQMGIARVTGKAILDPKNPANSSFNFTIYPSEQGTSPVNADGSWAQGQLPNVAAYTILTFKSKHVQLLDGGRLQLTGDLTVTHFERPVTLTYSEDYDGAKYGAPVVRNATREATFVFNLSDPDSVNGQDPKAKVGTASSILSGEDFPGLLNAVLNANWPVFVESEKSEMPATIGEDYSGASVSGEYAAKQTRPSISQPNIGEDYRGSDAFIGLAPNRVTIQARLVLNAGPAGQSLAAGN